jgi:membrane protein
MVFKILPDYPVEWRDVWLGAAVTALLFTGGKHLINLYILSSNMASTYGATGALIIVMVWIYYSAQILLLGAEFTKTYGDQRRAAGQHEKARKLSPLNTAEPAPRTSSRAEPV